MQHQRGMQYFMPYEEVKELLVKTAAFLGERLCDLCDMEWLPSVYGVGGKYPYSTFSPLITVVSNYVGNRVH